MAVSSNGEFRLLIATFHRVLTFRYSAECQSHRSKMWRWISA